MAGLTTIVVNYNHARFLPASLESILAQTRSADELIIIDDSSTDNSVEVISSYLSRHADARLIRNPVNQGCFANVNDGLQAAHGEIVHLAAADDVFYPRFYETGMRLIEGHPEAAFFSGRSDVIDEAGDNLSKPVPWAGHPGRHAGYISPAQAAHLLMAEDGWFMGNTALFRRTALLAEGGFATDLQSFADGFMCRLLALKHGACFTPEIVAAWRRMPSGFAASVNDDSQKAYSLIAIAEQRMRSAGDVFPAGYARRWGGRQRFEVERSALAKASALKSSRQRSGRLLVRSIEMCKAAWLLATLCPWDAAVNIKRRLQFYRGRI